MEEAKVLIELAKLSLSRYDERRKYEWRISFAFWALIVGAMIKKKELMIPLPGQYWISIVAGVLYAFLWLRSVWVADENDKRLGFYFRNEALSMLRDKNHRISPLPDKISAGSLTFWIGFLRDWAMWSHIFVTLTLIALFVSVR